MNDNLLPPMPGEEEEYVDYSDAPIRIEIKNEGYELTFAEAIELLSRLSTTMEIWWKMNGCQ